MGGGARHDIVLFGATGFTGRRAAAYLAEETQAAGLRFAIAGRDRTRLEALAAGLPGTTSVIVADGRDAAATRAMAAQSRVIASTAGPFEVYSDKVVDACVAEGSHYTDITGETPWVRRLIDRHHGAAAARGLRLVPLCGFDSVPADIGTLFVVDALRRRHMACRGVRSFYSVRGGFNGGTVASALRMSSERRRLFDAALLEPAEARLPAAPGSNGDPGPRWEPAVERWSTPFFMAPVNVAVVRRSAALARAWGESYGEAFSYGERLLVGGRLQGTLLTAGMAATFALMGNALGRRVVERFSPQPGSGPSEEAVRQGYFRCRLIGEGDDGQQVRAVFEGQGDPGNHATIRFLGQAALALAGDVAALPGGAERGGLLTPATAFGLPWVEALRGAGMKIELEG